MTLNKSPDRYTFQKNGYLDRKAEEGKTPENNEEVAAMVDYYNSWNEEKLKREIDPEWKENNMEYDLRSTQWICDKVKSSDVYAQNLYAAMCNNDFQQNDMMTILKDQRWSCSWRYAGGIVADMKEKGDYIDWYCSGIRGEMGDEEYHNLDKEAQERYLYLKTHFVPESHVTDEVREDLLKLGWIVIEE